MKPLHTLAAILLFGGCLFATNTTFADNAVPTSAQNGWGPSWVGGGPPGGLQRPAKFDAAFTRAAITDDQSRIGIAVRMFCDGDVVKGHQYQLLYQLRVHTKKGDEGPLLGNAAMPNGTIFVVTSGTADEKWNGLEGAADINRKDLSGMTNLPGNKTVMLRIEPQLFDQTTGKYLTVPKSNAIIVMADVGDNGRVDSVLSLSSWIMHNGQYETNAVLDAVATLDAYDVEGNNIADAFGNVLNIKDIPAATKLRLVRAVSKDWVQMRGSSLAPALTILSTSDDAELQAAAKELLK